MPRHARLVAALLVLPLLINCGGGGGSGGSGGGTEPNATLSGTYTLAVLAAGLVDTTSLFSAYGGIESTGDGHAVSGALFVHGEGTTLPGAGSDAPTTYSVSDTRNLAINGVPGRINASGTALIVGFGGSADTSPSVTAGLRGGSLPSVAPLAGTWETVEFGRTHVGAYHAAARRGTTTIDAGTFTYANTQSNYDGEIDPVFDLSIDRTIAVFDVDTGRVFVNELGGDDIYWYGGVSEDHNVMVLVGRLNSADALVRVMRRAGTGGLPNGTYRVEGIHTTPLNENARRLGELTFDSSTMTGTLTEVGVDPSGIASVTVVSTSPFLTLDITGATSGTRRVIGVLDGSGSFGALVGPFTTGRLPSIRYLVK